MNVKDTEIRRKVTWRRLWFLIFSRNQTAVIRSWKHKLFCKRVGIELTIGHLKSDYRLGYNFYKGAVGDIVNVLRAVAAYNFKRAWKFFGACFINLHFTVHLFMYHSAQRTDTFAHICPARTQEVAHRVIQVKHGRFEDFGWTVPSVSLLNRFRSRHEDHWETEYHTMWYLFF